MITTLPKPVKLWGRGQLTIPKDVREALRLGEQSHLTVFAVGPCLVLTPKQLVRASLVKEVERAMRAEGMSLEELLGALKKERRRYNRQAYAD